MPSDVAASTGIQTSDLGSDETSAHTLAVMVLAEMRKHRVLPTPRHYDLWFTFRVGSNPALTRRMAALLAARPPITPAALAALHDEFIAPPAADEGIDALGSIAEDLSEEVAQGQDAALTYGRALSDISAQLGSDPTVGSLVEALGTMAAETSRASERNRHLERQLAFSIARIDRLKRSLSASKAEATTDQLTGLLNRRAFEAKLRRALVQARSEPDSSFSLMMLDVDHFKTFNDEHGHAAGDLVLRMLARLLTESVKGRDIVARYGGEEFIILLPGTKLQHAAVVAGQIAASLSDRRLVSRSTRKEVGKVTVSIGVAESRSADTMVDLVERADTALYEAKRDGRNRVALAAS